MECGGEIAVRHSTPVTRINLPSVESLCDFITKVLGQAGSSRQEFCLTMTTPVLPLQPASLLNMYPIYIPICHIIIGPLELLGEGLLYV